MGKRGQMKLSFGMIFSILLIIAFLAFAFYAIKNFLGMQQDIQLKQFQGNFQHDIDKLWQVTSGTKEVEYPLPSNIKEVCFYLDEMGTYNTKLKKENIFLEYKMKNIDIPETIGNRDEICKKVVNGKINFKLQKEFDKPLVKIILN